jgi:hypothetical protein
MLSRGVRGGGAGVVCQTSQSPFRLGNLAKTRKYDEGNDSHDIVSAHPRTAQRSAGSRGRHEQPGQPAVGEDPDKEAGNDAPLEVRGASVVLSGAPDPTAMSPSLALTRI